MAKEIQAVAHLHSEWSYDARLSLTELASIFADRGARVLLMTEHDRGFTARRWREYRDACAAASSEKILLVPGIEYSDGENRVHVLVWGVSDFLGEGLPTTEMLSEAGSANGVAVLAHPSRKQAWQCFQPEWSTQLLGIEIWNRKYDGWAPGPDAPQLLRKAGAVPFAGLDFHTERQIFPLTMALEIEGECSEGTVLNCLRSRGCSPRAFGAPLEQYILGPAMPVLRMAERTRRAAARIARRTGVLSR